MAIEFLKGIFYEIDEIIGDGLSSDCEKNRMVACLVDMKHRISDFLEENAKNDEFVTEDLINRPSHYTREDAIECIDEMRLIFGDKAVMDFCKCNAWKYRYRAGQKKGEDGEKDIKKSDWYMRKFQELHTLADDELPWA